MIKKILIIAVLALAACDDSVVAPQKESAPKASTKATQAEQRAKVMEDSEAWRLAQDALKQEGFAYVASPACAEYKASVIYYISRAYNPYREVSAAIDADTIGCFRQVAP